MLSCRTLSDHERWVETDMSVSCNDGLYRAFSALAVCLVVLVVAGVPVMFIVIMTLESRRTRHHFQQTFTIVGGRADTEGGFVKVRARSKPRAGLSETMLMSTIPSDFWQYNVTLLREQYGAMIVESLKPRYIYYEALDWIRKVLLGGVLLMLHRGSLAQIFTAMAISFTAFGLHAALRPYRCTATNVLRACTEFATFLALATGLLLRFEGKGRAAGDVLQRSEYEWLVVGGFMVLVPGAFVACSAYSWAESRPLAVHTLRMGSIRSAQQRHQQRPTSFIQLDRVPHQRDSVASVASTATHEATQRAEESRREGLGVLEQEIALAKSQGETFEQFKARFRPVGVDGVLRMHWERGDDSEC